jgi:hypothetical protein
MARNWSGCPGGEVPTEPIRGDRQIVMAVGGASVGTTRGANIRVRSECSRACAIDISRGRAIAECSFPSPRILPRRTTCRPRHQHGRDHEGSDHKRIAVLYFGTITFFFFIGGGFYRRRRSRVAPL